MDQQKAAPLIAPMHHSIDFHAATVAADDKWRMILPGQGIRFEFVANFQNVGPNDQSSTHVIGAIFDRVWYEGNPKNEWRGMQTALIGSSNGAVLEFIVPEEGRYVLVDHEFADASKGAVGQIVATSRRGTVTLPSEPMQH